MSVIDCSMSARCSIIENTFHENPSHTQNQLFDFFDPSPACLPDPQFPWAVFADIDAQPYIQPDSRADADGYTDRNSHPDGNTDCFANTVTYQYPHGRAFYTPRCDCLD